MVLVKIVIIHIFVVILLMLPVWLLRISKVELIFQESSYFIEAWIAAIIGITVMVLVQWKGVKKGFRYCCGKYKSEKVVIFFTSIIIFPSWFFVVFCICLPDFINSPTDRFIIFICVILPFIFLSIYTAHKTGQLEK